MFFNVDIAASGALAVDGRDVLDDPAFLTLARAAHAKQPDGRAVIRADRNAKHQAVVHVMDMLKQAGFTKLAFGVSPISE